MFIGSIWSEMVCRYKAGLLVIEAGLGIPCLGRK